MRKWEVIPLPKINDTYDVGKAFEAIENELISSMIRNMKRHKVEEVTENKQWSMWQSEMLQSLEKYRTANQKKFGKQFRTMNQKIEDLIRMAKSDGRMDQEAAILEAIKKASRQRESQRAARLSSLKSTTGSWMHWYRLP